MLFSVTRSASVRVSIFFHTVWLFVSNFSFLIFIMFFLFLLFHSKSRRLFHKYLDYSLNFLFSVLLGFPFNFHILLLFDCFCKVRKSYLFLEYFFFSITFHLASFFSDFNYYVSVFSGFA